jgi:hypothetical protein
VRPVAPGLAAAQAPAVAFSGSYRAYNAWDDWKWWQPDKCTQTQPIAGFEPAAAGRYPVLLYVHAALADWVGNGEGKAIAQAAAAQGFVAAAPSYDSSMTTSATAVDGHARCLAADGRPESVLAQVCARPKADCSRGVVVAGFSAGGAVAGRLANVSSKVRAAWLIGVSGPKAAESLAVPAGTRVLPDARLRITVGRADVERRDAAGLVTGIDVSALGAIAGSACTQTRCLRADGSGFYVVDHAEVADGVADHCFWQSVNAAVPSNSCSSAPPMDPGFRPPSTAPWSLTANLAWLRGRLE